jgi:hypothetical protein
VPMQTPTRQGFGGRVIERMIGQLKGKTRFDWRAEAPDQEMPMSDDLTTMTIDGRVHTHMSNAFG